MILVEQVFRFSFLFEHDLFRPAFARRSIDRNDELWPGFAQAENRYPPQIKSGAGFFGIMR
jgi:hypothetical protein